MESRQATASGARLNKEGDQSVSRSSTKALSGLFEHPGIVNWPPKGGHNSLPGIR